MVREGQSQEVTLSKDLTEEGSSHGKIWGNTFGRDSCTCKGPEAAAIWRNMKDNVPE